ncbi:MAG: prolyl oligopeptidase family serine peptidase [Asticcacaulis sp.]
MPATPLPVLPANPVEPDRVIVLTEGAENEAGDEWPDRRFYKINRLELHEYKSRTQANSQAIGRALVYAGGGYLNLVHDKEGIEVALWLNALGFDAYVLVHRLPGTDNGAGGVHPKDIALTDGLKALDFLSCQSPLPLIHVGLSSGGHLAGVMACQPHDLKASGVIIAYAPINANHKDHKAPAGKPDFPPPEKQAFYNDWAIGITSEPHGIPPIPVFLAYALRDQVVPLDHALNLLKTMQTTGGDVEAHIFPDAPHGFALRELDGTHASWPHLAESWIDRVLTKKA